MNRSFSVYLDVVRFLAAIFVYLYHSNQRFLIDSILPVSNFGHSAVIVFFVLSGFVIAFVTSNKESTLPTYAASRLSRIFSVAIPAIVLTLLLDGFGRILHPIIYEGYPFDQFLARIAGSLFMVNEIWLISITSFSNVPYWSICFEWWYYIIFALVIFFPSPIGIGFAIFIMLLIGPKLILLAPIWWLGVLLYHWQALKRISQRGAGLMMLLSILGIVLFHIWNLSGLASEWLEGMIGPDLHRSLTFSKFFLADYLLGVLVFINFASVRKILEYHGSSLVAIERPVRLLASYTFTLYLLHQPLFLFWGSVVQGDPKKIWFWLTVTSLTAASVGLIGHFTESRRHTIRSHLLYLFTKWSALNPKKNAKYD